MITLILQLILVGANIFQDERKDRFLKKQKKLQEEYNEEMAKHSDDRSDLKLDQLQYDIEQLGALIISEAAKVK